jgi:hypothetical protein
LNRVATVLFTARAAIDPNKAAVVAAVADGKAAAVEAAAVVVAAIATGTGGGTKRVFLTQPLWNVPLVV